MQPELPAHQVHQEARAQQEIQVIQARRATQVLQVPMVLPAQPVPRALLAIMVLRVLWERPATPEQPATLAHKGNKEMQVQPGQRVPLGLLVLPELQVQQVPTA